MTLSSSINTLVNKIINKIISDIKTHNESDSSHEDIRTDVAGKADKNHNHDYDNLTNKPNIPDAVVIDTTLNTNSSNPVQNSTITTALNTKANAIHSHGNITNTGTINNQFNKNVVTNEEGKIITEDKPNIPEASTNTPEKDTTNGNKGQSDKYAREDHVHPKSSIYAEATHEHDIDAELKSNSTKPVQNKVILSALNNKANTSHSHGAISETGAIGSEPNKPIITTNSGKLITGSFGTTANTFCEGNDVRLSDARDQKATPIQANSNLNNLNDNKPGLYYCAQDATAATIQNKPNNMNRAFTLSVELLSNNFLKQTLTYWNDSSTWQSTNCNPQTFIRVSHYTGDWGRWREVKWNDEFHNYEVGDNTAGFVKLLTFNVTGSYSDSSINFNINTRNNPKTNVSINFAYYKKNANNSSFYYKVDKFYYDGQPLGIYLKQTIDDADNASFDLYVERKAGDDISISEIEKNWRTSVTVTKQRAFTTSLPNGVITATINPYYNAPEIVNNLVDGGVTKVLSAEQGKTLKSSVDSVYNLANSKPSLGTTENTAAKGNHTHTGDVLKLNSTGDVQITIKDAIDTKANYYHTHDEYLTEHQIIPNATDKVAGVVMLSSRVDSTSETLAATPNAINHVYELTNNAGEMAIEAQNSADTAYALANSKPDLGTTEEDAARGNHTHTELTNIQNGFPVTVHTANSKFKFYKSGKVVTMYLNAWKPNKPCDNTIHYLDIQLPTNPNPDFCPIMPVFALDIRAKGYIKIDTDGKVYGEFDASASNDTLSLTTSWITN